jgi:hypothetical protein
MLFPALSVEVDQRRRACVLDFSLALSRFGPAVARNLSDVLEVWIVPEMWHILDNTCLYLDKPELLLPHADYGGVTAERLEEASRETASALREWERLRFETDPACLRLYWIGDGPLESFLPSRVDQQILTRWTALAASLDARITGRLPPPDHPLAAAYRDTAALTAALGNAFILTCLLDSDDAWDTQNGNWNGDGGLVPSFDEKPTGLIPPICLALSSWGVPCRQLAAPDQFAVIERDQFRHLALFSGIAKYVWAGLRLAIVHLLVPGMYLPPSTFGAASDNPGPDERLERELFGANGASHPTGDLWASARGFWHEI